MRWILVSLVNPSAPSNQHTRGRHCCRTWRCSDSVLYRDVPYRIHCCAYLHLEERGKCLHWHHHQYCRYLTLPYGKVTSVPLVWWLLSNVDSTYNLLLCLSGSGGAQTYTTKLIYPHVAFNDYGSYSCAAAFAGYTGTVESAAKQLTVEGKSSIYKTVSPRILIILISTNYQYIAIINHWLTYWPLQECSVILRV